jgi:hypothetical protein
VIFVLAFRVVRPIKGGPGCNGGNPLRTRFLVCTAGGAGGGRPDRGALNGRGVLDRCTVAAGGGTKSKIQGSRLLGNAAVKRLDSATARCARRAGVDERIGGALATKGGGSIIKGARRGSALKGANGARIGPHPFGSGGLTIDSGADVAGGGPHIFGRRGLALASGAGAAGGGPPILGRLGLAADAAGGSPHPLGKDGLAR